MEAVRFKAEDGVTLEGELRLPTNAARGSAVICHADPGQGGSKDHPILWAIRNDLASRGFAVLSFNFRGVMGSDGDRTDGEKEVLDVAAAVGRVRQAAAGPTIACGWSFGANVALREAVRDERIAALALIGLPLGEWAGNVPDLPAASELREFRRPVLLVSGQGDTISPQPELRSLARKLPPAEVVIVTGTDHFFWRREKEVAGLIGDFSDRVISGALGDGSHRSR